MIAHIKRVLGRERERERGESKVKHRLLPVECQLSGVCAAAASGDSSVDCNRIVCVIVSVVIFMHFFCCFCFLLLIVWQQQ